MNVIERISLQGRAALVTGASSGIGLNVEHTPAAAGARMALAAFRIDRLDAASAGLRDKGHVAAAVPLDLTRPQEFAAAWQRAEAALDAIKAGELLASGDYNGLPQGCMGTMMAVRAVRNQPVPADLIFRPTLIEAGDMKNFDVSMASRACPAWEVGLKQATAK